MALLRLGRRRAAMLVVELNEGLVSRYQEQLRAPLRELRLLGCQLSVDHAGQEVVSTHYIREFELSFLKIHPAWSATSSTDPSIRWRYAPWWEVAPMGRPR
jgi:RNase E specificity factor CsrD